MVSSKRKSPEVSEGNQQTLTLLSVLPTCARSAQNKRIRNAWNGSGPWQEMDSGSATRSVVDEAIELVELRKRIKRTQRQTSSLSFLARSCTCTPAQGAEPEEKTKTEGTKTKGGSALANYSTLEIIQALLEKKQQQQQQHGKLA